MLIPVVEKGHSCLALAIPGINMRADVKHLRNALLDVIETCLISEDAKECTESRSFAPLFLIINELNRDLEDKEKGE